MDNYVTSKMAQYREKTGFWPPKKSYKVDNYVTSNGQHSHLQWTTTSPQSSKNPVFKPFFGPLKYLYKYLYKYLFLYYRRSYEKNFLHIVLLTTSKKMAILYLRETIQKGMLFLILRQATFLNSLNKRLYEVLQKKQHFFFS